MIGGVLYLIFLGPNAYHGKRIEKWILFLLFAKFASYLSIIIFACIAGALLVKIKMYWPHF